MSAGSTTPTQISQSSQPPKDPHLLELLERYLGSSVTSFLLDEGVDSAETHIYASVLFADIRDFTTLAESTDERDLFREVNQFYSIIVDAIYQHGGIVNSFGGDSILAVFGAPNLLEDHAAAALLTSSSIMDALVGLNKERENRSRPPFRVGIGVHSGTMMMGNIGSSRRQTFTVIGDAVNCAKRLSDLSKESPFYSIFASYQTIVDLHTRLPVNWQLDELGEISVRGRQKTLRTFAITPDSCD